MDIGKEQKEVTFEPVETPRREPVEPALPEPAQEPVREPEPVGV